MNKRLPSILPSIRLSIFLCLSLTLPSRAAEFASAWRGDRVWAGPQYWANPLQDWRIEGDAAVGTDHQFDSLPRLQPEWPRHRPRPLTNHNRHVHASMV